ncbi:hypothetical protein ACR4U3_001404 [Salmonella enterica]|nr:hypothetical protein [Salmonella enterica]
MTTNSLHKCNNIDSLIIGALIGLTWPFLNKWLLYFGIKSDWLIITAGAIEGVILWFLWVGIKRIIIHVIR